MAELSTVLLLIGVAGALGRPFGFPAWVVPFMAAIVTVAAGVLSVDAAHRALDPLGPPIAFLLAAVPLAVLLDGLGFFAAVAGVLTRHDRGPGGLWILAALVTSVLNLDASVVLLTPLYVKIAQRAGWDPLALAFQPVLLACLASSALPVSNLTNLIVSSWTGAGTKDFLLHLGLPSLVATTVGWWGYRAHFGRELLGRGASGAGTAGPEKPGASRLRSERRTLWIGGAVVAGVLVGFTAGRLVGVMPWMVAAGADVVLIFVVRRPPWQDIPAGTALLAGALGVLAAGSAVHLPVTSWIHGSSPLDLARTAVVSGLAANAINNLPALLITLPVLGHRSSPAMWAVLLGVNMGPVVLLTGSLASLLWLATLRRLDVAVRARDFTRVGVRVGVPAAAAGLSVELLLQVTGLIRG